MALERIDRAADPRVEAYRSLREADLLRTRGVFVAEGRFVVRRVLADERFRVESLLVNEAALRDLAEPISRLDADVPVYVCPTGAFLGLTGFDLHRGCLALVRSPPPQAADAVIDRARTLVVLEAVSNADNVGGIFRNAAAFGADGVLLGPATCDPLYRKAIRTSMGAALRVPFARCDADGWPAPLARARAAGFTIVALTPRAPSDPLEQIVPRLAAARVALVLGSEGAGLTDAVEAMADYRVRIPVSEQVDSLNVAVAAGIALYRVMAAR